MLSNPTLTSETQIRRRVRAWWADTAILAICTVLTELALHEAVTTSGVRLSPGARAWADALGLAVVVGPLFGWTLYRRHVDSKFARVALHATVSGSPHAKVRLAMLGSLFVLAVIIGIGHYLERAALTTAAEAGTTINLAGRQRFLSQRLALATTQLEREPNQREVVRETAEQLRVEASRLDVLIDRLVAGGAPDSSLTEARRAAALARTALLTAVQAQTSTDSVAWSTGVIAHADSMLTAQDRFTTLLANHVNTGLDGLARSQRALGLALWAILIGIAGLVVEPVVRLLRRQHAAAASRTLDFERLAMVAQRTSNAVVITDAERRITWANDGFTNITGWELADVVGRRPGDFLQCPDTDPAAVALIREGLQNACSVRTAILNVHRDGTRYWLDLSIEPLWEQGVLTGFIAVETDITEQVRAKQALEDKQAVLARTTAQLEEAQSVARLGSWEFEFSTGTVDWSAETYNLFGLDPADGTPDYETVMAGYEPDDAQRLAEAVQRAAATGEAYSLILRTSGRNPMVRWVRGDGRARWASDRSVVALFGTVTDVTESIEREEALREAQARAEAASRSKSEFLANMSHEIRTPLTAILGFADILGDEAIRSGATRDQLHALETIQRAGHHLLTVINDILDISKIEAGKLEIETVTTPLPAVLLDVESLMRARALTKGVTLETRVLTPVPDRIITDPTRLRQILMNLVGNATKFTERGRILIETSVEEERRGETLVIAVDDTGPGMTDEQVTQLFQPFTQADSSVTRKHGGTGLGLTICRRLAQLMGGEVELVQTAPGRGSRFELRLPLNACHDAMRVQRLMVGEDPVMSTTTEPTTLRGRILLAEDGEDNQRLIGLLLRAAGADVTIVANGRQAIASLEWAASAHVPFDLLLTDMQMPEMDGYTLARSLRAAGSTIPIIALTAHAMAEDRARCLEAGCDDYATKPIDRRALIATCAHWMPAVVELFPAPPAHAENAPLPRASESPADVWPDVLHSELQDDPDVMTLVRDFAEALPARVAAIVDCVTARDGQGMARLTHQLKGAAGSYGYPIISELARQLEQSSHLGVDADVTATLKQLSHLAEAARKAFPPALAARETDT